MAQPLSGPLVDALGGKRALLAASLVLGGLSIALPSLADTSLALLVLSQLLAGLVNGVAVPSFHTLLSREAGGVNSVCYMWEPRSERGRLATVIFSGSPLSSLLSLLATGYLTHYVGWRLPFYIFGGLSFVWAVPWACLVHDSPADDPRIGEDELRLLQAEAEAGGERPRLREVPLASILASRPVWAMVAANAAYTLGHIVVSTQLPLLLDRVFGAGLADNGRLSALPFALRFAFAYAATAVLGSLRRRGLVGDEASSKLATGVALLGMAVFYGAVPTLGTTAETTSLLVSIGYALTGAQISGAWSNPLDLAPNFAATLMGLSGLLSYFVSGLLPLAYSSVVADRDTMEGWSGAIYATVAVPAVACAIYLLCGTTQVQDWNYVAKTDDKDRIS